MTTVKKLLACCLLVTIAFYANGQSPYASDNLLIKPGATPIAALQAMQVDYGIPIANIQNIGIAGIELWSVDLPIIYEENGLPRELNNIIDVLNDVQQRLQGNDGSDVGLNYDLANPLPVWLTNYGLNNYDPLPNCDEDYTIPPGPNFVRVGIIDSGMDMGLFLSSPRVRGGSHYNITENTSRNIYDADGHGTLITGIIDNMLDVSGVNNATISMYQVGDQNGVMRLADLIAAVSKVIEDDIDVLQIALGYFPHQLDQSTFLWEVLNIAAANDILPIVAAGNDNLDLNTNDYYPSGLELHGAIKVAAIDCNFELASFSNYGMSSVNLAVPGVDVLGPQIGGDYYLSKGTSQASAIATSCAAILATHLSTASALYCSIQSTVEQVPALSYKVNGGRVLYDLNSAYNAIMQNPNYCGSFGNNLFTNQTNTGMLAVAEEPGFQLSPNPFSDDLTIQLETPEPTKGVLKLFSLTGQLLDEVRLTFEKGANRVLYTPPLARLTQGTHIILIQTGSQTYQQKVVFAGH